MQGAVNFNSGRSKGYFEDLLSSSVAEAESGDEVGDLPITGGEVTEIVNSLAEMGSNAITFFR